MGRAEGFASAESYVWNAGIHNAPGEIQSLGAIQLIAPGPVGAGLLAAGEAARGAAIGQLPGKKKGRAVFAYGAPRHYGLLNFFR
jgi:hypothetical protein